MIRDTLTDEPQHFRTRSLARRAARTAQPSPVLTPSTPIARIMAATGLAYHDVTEALAKCRAVRDLLALAKGPRRCR